MKIPGTLRKLKMYEIDTLRADQRFTVEAYSKNEAAIKGRYECYKNGAKFIRVMPVRDRRKTA